MRRPWQKRDDAPKRLSGRAAQERRKRWLFAHPVCVHCEAKGRVTAGEAVDHVVPLARGGADDETNLQTLCNRCHDEKSARERGFKVRPRIGLDGYPIDN